MYTYEDRMRAINLYLHNGHKANKVIDELGYPERHMLHLWYKEYIESGDLHKNFVAKKKKYSEQQKETAVQFYLEHDHSLKQTIQTLGYPSESMLKYWVREFNSHRQPVLTKA